MNGTKETGVSFLPANWSSLPVDFKRNMRAKNENAARPERGSFSHSEFIYTMNLIPLARGRAKYDDDGCDKYASRR